MTDYFVHVKGLADQLAAAGNHVSDDDVIDYLFSGLDNSYDALVTSINLLQASGGVSLHELYSHMMSYEARQESNNTGYQLSANLAGRSSGNRGGRSGG